MALRQYKGAVKRIEDKTKKLKSLKSEQKNLSPIHFLRHNELAEQIENCKMKLIIRKTLKPRCLTGSAVNPKKTFRKMKLCGLKTISG